MRGGGCGSVLMSYGIAGGGDLEMGFLLFFT